MKAANSIAEAREGKKSFSAVISGKSMQEMLSKTLNDPSRAANFASTLISVVSSSPQLQNCDPNTIISAALRGEGMNLSIALGQYSVVPYGNKANYQLSYKGLSQLAIRSGKYVDFDVYDVRKGEYKGCDPKTRAPIIEWIADDEVRENTPIYGFYGFYELKTGFFKSVFWTHEKILKHADRYSKAFSLDKYRKLQAGELSESEAEKVRNGSPWYDDPTSEAHMKMCKKTLLIQMLNDGKAPLSIEMQQGIEQDNVVERGAEVIYDSSSFFADPATGEVKDTPAAETAQDKPVESPVTEVSDKPSNDTPKAKKSKVKEEAAQDAEIIGEDEAYGTFFD